MTVSYPVRRAGRILRAGGVVAYPTEGVFGLGCIPDYADAVIRILSIKQRDPVSGLVLVASHFGQLDGWVDLPDSASLASTPERPVTWVVPAAESVPFWIRGSHDGVAVRITTHPVAAALCDAADSALVSTSANVAGGPPARNALVLRRRFGGLVDCIVPGGCGPAAGPSEIREWPGGRILRAGRS